MMRKLAATFALLMGVLVLLAPISPAQAGDPPSDYADCIITATPDQLEPGADVDVSGTGLQPNLTTDVIFDLGEPDEAVLGSITTDASGAFGPATFAIPDDASEGMHTISVSCDGVNVNSTEVEVAGADVVRPPTGGGGGVGGGGLARTGSDVEPLVVAAGVALLAGAAFVVAAKRRRSSSAS